MDFNNCEVLLNTIYVAKSKLQSLNKKVQRIDMWPEGCAKELDILQHSQICGGQ